MAVDVEELIGRLRAAGCVFAEDEADVILEEAWDADHLEEMVRAREAGTPLEQVVGWAGFRGLRLRVAPGVFVPRLRSGLVVDLALALLPPGAVVVDLCCGTGALGAALLAEAPGIELHAADSDSAAVTVALENLALPHPGDAFVHDGDLYAALPRELLGRVDVVVCNAPYVPTAGIATMPAEARDHEHLVALDGGEDGLEVHRRVAAGIRDWLAPGGALVLETSRAQAPATAGLLAAVGLTTSIEVDDDLDGTAVLARRGPTTPGTPRPAG